MLKELSVQNLALLKQLHLELDEGLTVLTGTTGAGKSIIVGAIGLLLGDKAGAHMVRQGAPSTTVEGVFDLSQRKGLLEHLSGMDLETEDGLLILKRQITPKGDSKAYLNGSRITLARMKEIGEFLVDLHGQHDHQSLLRPAEHLDLLDEYGELHAQREETRLAWRRLKDLHAEERTLSGAVQQRRERRELIEYHLQEIEHLAPKDGEEENLEAERKLLENAEELFAGLSAAYGIIFENDGSVIGQLSAVRSTLEKLSLADARLQEKGQECTTLIYQLEDLASSLRGHLQNMRPDPDRLSEISDRLDALRRLARKHGGSIAAVQRRRQELAAELNTLVTGDERLQQLQTEMVDAGETFARFCRNLSASRAQAAQNLQIEVEEQLEKLGMPKTKFSVEIQQIGDEQGWGWMPEGRFSADATGMDRVQFLLSPNPGEGLRPLAKIASGGEISRIMLAMKTVLARADRIPLLIFDEIDVGIGGQVAQAVGMALESLGRTHQVLCITHLHQIACLADHHLYVYKEQKRGRTETVIQNLSPQDREREIARMMGGKEITSITLEHAREMMRQRDPSQASP